MVEEMMNSVDHEKLLQCVGVELTKSEPPTKKQKRSEMSKNVSLFSLSQVDESGSSTKVDLQQLLRKVPLTKKTDNLKRKLSKVRETKKQLSAPLPKPISEKIQRKVDYKKVSDDVGKWDSIVQKRRRAEHLQFPLNQEPFHIKTVDEFFKPKNKNLTPLEKEMHALLSNNKCIERPDHELTEMEEEALAVLTLEEANARINELRKHRALLSYQQVKANRTKKIKSRNYHRMLKKQKIKEMSKLPPVEEDPEEADRRRAEERASQRHRKGSKWARRNQMIAKTNEKIKSDLEEQQRKHVELMEKQFHIDSDTDEEQEQENIEDIDFFKAVQHSEPVVQLHHSFAKDNPWLRNDTNSNILKPNEKESHSKMDNSNKKTEDFDVKKVAKKRNESMHAIKDISSRERVKLQKWLNSQELPTAAEVVTDDAAQNKFKDAVSNLAQLRHENVEPISEENDSMNLVIASEEDDGLLERNVLADNNPDIDPPVKSDSNKTIRIKQIEDNTLLKGNINFDFVSALKPISRLKSSIVEDEEDGQKITIEEAFADDNVVREFRQEKKDFVDKATEKEDDINVPLPGWGRWDGSGIRNKVKKRSKKPQPKTRSDSKLGHVILNDKRDVYIARHQVHTLPFPFVNNKQFENTIARPVGSTWNTPEVFSAAIKPKIVTPIGTIIPPMSSKMQHSA